MRMRNPAPSLPDTRQVTIIIDTVIIDGRDISNMVTGARFIISAYDAFPVLELEMDPDELLYSGPAIVPEVPLDGIERLRKWLGQP